MTNDFELANTRLDTDFGTFEIFCFRFGDREEDNILCLFAAGTSAPPYCRVQSACYTAEIFRSRDCDCHAQLSTSLRLISNKGGYLIYVLCDGRGAGIFTKLQALELTRVMGYDTAQAYDALHVPPDPRDYARPAAVLRHLGVKTVRLLTNNPRKVEGLSTNGVQAIREPLEIPATAHSKPYLLAKKEKLGHLLTQFDTT